MEAGEAPVCTNYKKPPVQNKGLDLYPVDNRESKRHFDIKCFRILRKVVSWRQSKERNRRLAMAMEKMVGPRDTSEVKIRNNQCFKNISVCQDQSTMNSLLVPR